jgi:glycosyltransferase involved in cell wall biosynthesis
MPTVLQLISSSGFYGADNVLVELSKQLKKTDFKPIVGVFNNLYNPHLEIAKAAESFDLPVHIFPCRGKLDHRTILLLRQFHQKQNIGLIHAHGYKTNFYVLASSIGKTVPRITTCHNWLGDDSKMRFYAWLDKTLLKRFDKVVAVSDPVMQEIRRHGIKSGRAVKILNGIDVEKFSKQGSGESFRSEFGIPENAVVIGTVGRLAEEKGHSLLLDAALRIVRHHPNVVFIFIGDGPLRRDLETKAGEVSNRLERSKNDRIADHFIFAGVRDDMPEMYGIMDFFILPSMNEGLPMVLLEAMASGKPIIATSVGAIPKVLDGGRHGVLIQPDDRKELEDAMLGLLGNPHRARKLGERARERAVKDFSSKSMADKYIEIYKELLRIED